MRRIIKGQALALAFAAMTLVAACASHPRPAEPEAPQLRGLLAE